MKRHEMIQDQSNTNDENSLHPTRSYRKILLYVPDSRIQMQLVREILDHNLEGPCRFHRGKKVKREHYEITVCGKSEKATDLFFHLVGLFRGVKVEMFPAPPDDITKLRYLLTAGIISQPIDNNTVIAKRGTKKQENEDLSKWFEEMMSYYEGFADRFYVDLRSYKYMTTFGKLVHVQMKSMLPFAAATPFVPMLDPATNTVMLMPAAPMWMFYQPIPVHVPMHATTWDCLISYVPAGKLIHRVVLGILEIPSPALIGHNCCIEVELVDQIAWEQAYHGDYSNNHIMNSSSGSDENNGEEDDSDNTELIIGYSTESSPSPPIGGGTIMEEAPTTSRKEEEGCYQIIPPDDEEEET